MGDAAGLPTQEPLLEPSAASRGFSRYFALLILQSLSFFLTFAAFNAAQSLDGSIAAPPGLASASFSGLYILFALFAIPAPKLLSFLGPKTSMSLGLLPYVGLIASFLAPVACSDDSGSGDDSSACWPASVIWAVRMTPSLLVGLGAPIVWTGQGVYLARLAAHDASHQSALNGREADVGPTLKRYNGVFFAIFQLSGATGLVGASLVLTLDHSSSAKTLLFVVLSVCCVGGLSCIALFLPALPPVASATASAEEDATLLSTLYLCADPRMLLIVPNIVYNGLSLAFIWYLYSTFVFNTALGTSFVGFGAASGYLVNAIATSGMSRMAQRCGQLPTMALASAVHSILWILMLWYTVRPVQCLASGCEPGTIGSCWRMPPGVPHSDTFPRNCSGHVPCAQCEPYDKEAGQACSSQYTQCEWLHGDAQPPAGADVAFMLLGMAAFHLGDAVWESQVPAVLQTLFDAQSGSQPAAMANLKLWQSLGIGTMFGLAQMNNLKPCAALLLAALALSSASLLYVHTRVANLDSGKRRIE